MTYQHISKLATLVLFLLAGVSCSSPQDEPLSVIPVDDTKLPDGKRIDVNASGEGLGGISRGGIFTKNNFVVFNSVTLNPSDAIKHAKIYLSDIANLQTVSLAEVNSGSILDQFMDIDASADGHYVVFSTDVALVAADLDAERDIYLKNTKTGLLSLISLDAPRQDKTIASYAPTISDDGRYVAYTAEGTLNSVAVKNVILMDRLTAVYKNIDLGHQSVISGDGSTIFYMTQNHNQLSFFRIQESLVGILIKSLGESNPEMKYAVSFDGKTIAFAFEQASADYDMKQVYVARTEDFKKFSVNQASLDSAQTPLQIKQDFIQSIQLDDAGTYLAYNFNDDVYVRDLQNKGTLRLANGVAPFISPDGFQIGYSHGDNLFVHDNPFLKNAERPAKLNPEPGSLETVSNASGVNLRWQTYDGASYYRVYLSGEREILQNTSKAIFVFETSESSLVISRDELPANLDNMYLAVVAVNADGEQQITVEQVIESKIAPSSIQNFSVLPKANAVTLNWDAVDDVSYYEIFFSTKESDLYDANYPAQVSELDTEAHSLINLTANTTYYIKVSALLLTGERTESRILSAKPEGLALSFADSELQRCVYSKGSNSADVLSFLNCDSYGIQNLDGIEQLTNLETLSLGNNQISAIPQMSALSSLAELNLSGNLIKSIPDTLGLPSLAKLDLSNNELAVVPDLVGVPLLSELNLAGNQLTSIADFSHTPNLKILYVSRNKLTSLPSLASTSINELYLEENSDFHCDGIDALDIHYDLGDGGLSGSIQWSECGAPISVTALLQENMENLADLTQAPWGIKLNDVTGAGWQLVNSSSHSGLTSAQTIATLDGEKVTLSMSVTMEAEGYVSFARRMQNEKDSQLSFQIDGIEKARWAGSHDWKVSAFNMPAGEHVIEWTFTSNSSPVTSDYAWIDDIALYSKFNGFSTAMLSEEESFESGAITSDWASNSSGSVAGWVVGSGSSYSGIYSLKSLPISNGQQNTLSRVINLPATGYVAFAKKVSSEQFYDFFEFLIDGKVFGTWSGESDWESKLYELTAGSHTLEWRYKKDQNDSSGVDAAWIDDFKIYTKP